jgi:hypothetical protein
LFPWLIWVAAFVGLLFFVDLYGANHPLWDEWQNVPYLTGDIPPTWQNLCTPAGWGHRVPLLRLLLIGLARWTDFNFRAPMFLAVVLLALLAAVFIVVARQLRGRSSISDAFLVLVCLNIGHWENLLQGWNLQNILFAFLAALALACIVLKPRPRLWLRLGLGACLVLLPWASGLAGLILSAPLVLFLAASTISRFLVRSRPASLESAVPLGQVPRTPNGQRTRISDLMVSACVIVAVAGIWEYCRGMDMSPAAPVTWSDALQGSAIFLSTPLISTGIGPDRWMFFSLTLGLCLSAGISVLALWWAERFTFRLAGLTTFLAAMIGIALAVGWGRSGISPDYCHSSRYVALATPFVLAVYLSAVLARNRVSSAIQWLMLLAVGAALPSKVTAAIAYAEQHQARSVWFQRDVASGMSPEQLAASPRNRWLNPALDRVAFEFHKNQMITALKILEQRGIRPFPSPRARDHLR